MPEGNSPLTKRERLLLEECMARNPDEVTDYVLSHGPYLPLVSHAQVRAQKKRATWFRFACMFGMVLMLTAGTVYFTMYRGTFSKAAPAASSTSAKQNKQKHPLVIWHGLGDSFSGAINKKIESAAKLAFNASDDDEVDVYPIALSSNWFEDTRQGILGDIVSQLYHVCDDLYQKFGDNSIDGVGFSQGGLFLRALVHMCPTIRMRVLITIASPHQGYWSPAFCDLPQLKPYCYRNWIVKNIYSETVQRNLVPATYVKMPLALPQYRKSSRLLAALNSEYEGDSEHPPSILPSGPGLPSLKKLVLVRKTNDTVLIPRDSAWFGDTDGESKNVVPMRETELYKSDTTGLRTLDEKKRILFEEIPGNHLDFTAEDVQELFEKYLI